MHKTNYEFGRSVKTMWSPINQCWWADGSITIDSGTQKQFKFSTAGRAENNLISSHMQPVIAHCELNAFNSSTQGCGNVPAVATVLDVIAECESELKMGSEQKQQTIWQDGNAN